MTVLTPANAFPNLPFPQHYAQADKARSFNGTSTDHIYSAFAPGTAGGSWSWAAWVNLGSVANGTNYTIFGTQGATNGFLLRWLGNSSTTGSLNFVCSNVVNIGSSNTITVSASTWHHAGLTYDGTNFVFYWDGVAVGSGSNAQTVTGVTLSIGSDHSNTSGFMLGSLADMAVWNAILTAGNYATLASPARANSLNLASLAFYMPMTGAVPEEDFAKNNNGTVFGTTVVAGPPGLGPVLFPSVQSFTYPGAVWPNVNPPPPNVLSFTNGFPNLAFPQHKSGQTTTVQDFLYPGAVQPAVAAAAFLAAWARNRNYITAGVAT